MAPRLARRLVLLAVLVAVVAVLAWLVLGRPWREDSPESRLRDAAEDLRDRIRELTH